AGGWRYRGAARSGATIGLELVRRLEYLDRFREPLRVRGHAQTADVERAAVAFALARDARPDDARTQRERLRRVEQRERQLRFITGQQLFVVPNAKAGRGDLHDREAHVVEDAVDLPPRNEARRDARVDRLALLFLALFLFFFLVGGDRERLRLRLWLRFGLRLWFGFCSLRLRLSLGGMRHLRLQ